MKNTVRWAVFTVLFCLCSMPALAAVSVPEPTSRFFVNDYANVLSEESENYICETSQLYAENNGTQIVVTTVESLDGNSIEQYALTMGREWGIGSEKENNGLLILLALKEREIRIEVGYGLEGTITDSLSGRFIRQVTPELKENNFDAGLVKLYDLVIAELEEPGTFEEEHGEDETSEDWILAVIIVLLILFISFIHRHKGGGGNPGGRSRRYYRGPYDAFGTPGRFGGGYSGGGFTGGGFSGGGGSFGGGGASGKF
ncbi:MAG: TPM domain-containing protein [Lachnospiraceae bacterium]